MYSFFTRRTASMAAVAAAICLPAAVQAQERSFDIPAHPASSGVREFARQAGIQVTLAGRDGEGRTTNAVQGNLDIRDALDRLLSGTGLVVRSFDGKIAILGMQKDVAEGGGGIVVTGTRIVRDGYQAPTPVTVLGAAEIARRAPHNVAELVNQLPALAGSQNPQMGANNISSGVTGINALNLRGIGQTRTLVLFDGQRMPAASLSGLVDVNTIPNALIKRVDIVTGGASAAWGSDAVAGVVNFVLDKSFTGIKGDVQGGVTTYGDDKNFRVSLTAGANFADERGHVLLSVEDAYNEGIVGIGKRDWYVGIKGFNNPAYAAANGQPEIIVSEHVGLTTAGPGAIVTAGPLRGLYFGPGGTTAQLTYGSVVRDPYMIGGDWRSTHFDTDVQTFDPKVSRQNAFGRLSYDLTDTVQVFGQFSYSRSKGTSVATPYYNFGSLSIGRDNAFLPAEIVQKMTDLNLPSLTVGTWNKDLGGILTVNVHKMYRYVAGASGAFGAFGSSWKWDVTANRNVSNFYDYAISPITANYRRAIDAVVGPNGAIVCRSTLTNPADGCVPYNIFGVGVASDAGKNYVQGKSYVDATLTQDVFSATVRGDAFSTWAGPVSLAAGFEHRREKETGTADRLSLKNGYWAGNFKPIKGSYTVDEGFLEVAVPLAKDARWAKSLDLNAAVRATHYSTSGYVTTWKVGASYAPIDDIRFRITRSRDIRAANLAELFQAGTAGTYLFLDPQKNESYQFIQLTSGNPSVKPEKADTLNVGVVLQPRFVAGLSASVDYWDIKIRDAISTPGYATFINRCYEGIESYCQYVERDATGYIKYVYSQPVNIAKATTRGVDFDVTYRLPISNLFMGSGSEALTLRALATRNIKSLAEDGIGLPNSALGEVGGLPKWRYLLEAVYTGGPVTVSVAGRGISSSVYDASYIECSSNCPVSSAAHRTINDNHVAGAFYVDTSVAVKIWHDVELYLSVDNLFNKDPAKAATVNYIGGAIPGSSPTFYDILGRRFRSGLRFKF
ncbi:MULTISPECIES: TonB-dependent receptor [unclassified Sphingomonas]|uniref:TonB-dependent receptor n=3 Tax=Sphingomonas TaxID=13687 RepID=UPI0009E768E3|nr:MULTISPECIES: TonB-dependent receptor [unclassified Sphingomonas]